MRRELFTDLGPDRTVSLPGPCDTRFCMVSRHDGKPDRILLHPPPKPQGQWRSHNERADGGALINYNEPENAGLPHKGKIGEQEAVFVRDNLELVNQRRTAAGHPAIDPANQSDAKRYGFEYSQSDQT